MFSFLFAFFSTPCVHSTFFAEKIGDALGENARRHTRPTRRRRQQKTHAHTPTHIEENPGSRRACVLELHRCCVRRIHAVKEMKELMRPLSHPPSFPLAHGAACPPPPPHDLTCLRSSPSVWHCPLSRPSPFLLLFALFSHARTPHMYVLDANPMRVFDSCAPAYAVWYTTAAPPFFPRTVPLASTQEPSARQHLALPRRSLISFISDFTRQHAILSITKRKQQQQHSPPTHRHTSTHTHTLSPLTHNVKENESSAVASCSFFSVFISFSLFHSNGCCCPGSCCPGGASAADGQADADRFHLRWRP